MLNENQLRILYNANYSHYINKLLAINDNNFVKNIIKDIQSLQSKLKSSNEYKNARNNINKKLRSKFPNNGISMSNPNLNINPTPYYGMSMSNPNLNINPTPYYGMSMSNPNNNLLSENEYNKITQKYNQIFNPITNPSYEMSNQNNNYEPGGFIEYLNSNSNLNPKPNLNLNPNLNPNPNSNNGTYGLSMSVPTVLNSNIQNIKPLHIFLFGHGSIIEKEFIVVPEKINITFYTVKGKTLTTIHTNRVLNRYNETSITYDKFHYISQNTLMNNMIVTLNPFFFDKNNIIEQFEYTGIVTGEIPTPFFKLNESIFKEYGMKVSNIINISDIEKKFKKVYLKNKTIIGNKKIIGNRIKILDLGEQIYGLIYEKKRGVSIINNMDDEDKDKNILLQYIKQSFPNSNVPLILSKFKRKKYEDVITRIKNLCLHFNDDNIITKEEILANKLNLFRLNILLNHIHQTYPNDYIICHGIICRTYIASHNYKSYVFKNSIYNNIENINSAISTNIKRIQTANETYKTKFGNILERFITHIDKLCNILKNKFPNEAFKMNQIKDYILEFNFNNKYLHTIHVDFIYIILNYNLNFNNNSNEQTIATYLDYIRNIVLWKNFDRIDQIIKKRNKN